MSARIFSQRSARLVDKYKKLILVEVAESFFILHLGMESSVGRLDQQSSLVMGNVFI